MRGLHVKSDRSIVQIARKFHLQAQKIDCISRGVYRLSVKDGSEYCLKRMGYPKNRLIWMDTVLLELRRKGFQTFAWRDPKSHAGKILLVRPDSKSKPYILTPWLHGRTPSPTSDQDMYVCAQTLARFHRTGQSVQIPTNGAENLLGQWPELIKIRTASLERRINKAKSRRKASKLDDLLCEHGNNLIKRAKQALQTFNKIDYYELCEYANNNGAVLCHADSGPKNFVITEEGPSLIDFESLRIDLRIYDLFRLIRLASKKNRWKFSIARAVLDGYRSISELEPVEYDLLAAWLSFPQKVYRMLTRYERAEELERDDLAKKLEKELKVEQPISALLRQLSNYAARSGDDAALGNDQ
jgi:CotS family spore coat protein